MESIQTEGWIPTPTTSQGLAYYAAATEVKGKGGATERRLWPLWVCRMSGTIPFQVQGGVAPYHAVRMELPFRWLPFERKRPQPLVDSKDCSDYHHRSTLSAAVTSANRRRNEENRERTQRRRNEARQKQKTL
ncbi:hypothetical protein RvY_12592 [Ramazzottius varieornatus]|uniref:Uncharacterized protein n=1 Tax=Ramazzottius varieornatus TaxID=947166 RepID=A0A1D1VK34_RAMVA|nr:hypothetical protein RvY_12592 [Ramazzottius varieornatus]